MNDLFEQKIKTLNAHLINLKKVMVAFSGGKDSSFLLAMALNVLGKENTVACNVRTMFSTHNDQKRVDYFSGMMDFTLEKMFFDISGDNKILANPKDRCYHCKKKIFNALKAKAAELGITHIIDGTTCSDLNEYRPGLQALEELHIISPLRDAEITSKEVVEYLKEKMHVEDYFLTSSACLATRFPYNMNLEEPLLRKFDEIENYFVQQGIFPVKVRFIPEGIKIETPHHNFIPLFEKREETLKFCKNKGFRFITLDLEGIKTGVWD